ncbi:MAG: hypothetical protein HN793_04025, partial [Rhodospirillaceae bacterium]|nr:hypothetical protein [Rhodospirillaceae bacterium]
QLELEPEPVLEESVFKSAAEPLQQDEPSAIMADASDEPERPQIQPEPDVSDKPEPDPIETNQPDRSKLEPLTTGRTARLMAEDAADQRSQTQRGQSKKKERDPNTLEPDPIPDAPMPGSQAAAGSQQKPAAQRVKKSGGFGRFVTYMVLLIVIVAAAFGTMPWWYGRMPTMVQNWVPETLRPPTAQVPGTVVADITSLQQRLAATDAEVASLRLAIQSTPQSAAPNTQAVDSAVAALQQRLAALESRPAQISSGSSATGINGDAVTALGNAAANQAQQLASVTARIATVEAALGNAAQLDAVADRVDALEDRSADAATVLALAARITQVEAAADSLVKEQTGAVGLLLAVSQLQDATSNGRPFALELETVQAFAAKQDRLSIDTTDLTHHRSAGVSTRAVLRQEFDRLAPVVVRAGLLPTDTASWLQRTLDSIFSVINVRRLDDDGSAAVGAIVTRMERALDVGNLEAAITASNDLSGLAAETISPWLTKARATASVERAVTTLSTQAIAQINAGRDFGSASSETDD